MTPIPLPTPDPKPWYTSKTIWLNAVTTLIGVLSLLAGTSDLLSPEITKWILVVVGVLNVVVRYWFTDNALAH